MKVAADHASTSLASREMPMVSIVITAYNAERFIGSCINAALAQTYPNFEVLVVDDGSTDGTTQICRSVTDPRFRYVTWGRLGRTRALNAGVDAAKGEYIAINDADDLSLPHRLQYSMDFIRQHQNIAYLGTRFVKSDTFYGSIPDNVITEAQVCGKNLLVWPKQTDVFRRNVFNNSTLLYPKSTWQRIGGYDEQLTNSEDYDFYLRALQCGPTALLPGRTVLWYTNPHGFFKQITQREHLKALGFIKRRAHRLLMLPGWMRLYHPVWIVWFELVRWFPCVLTLVRDIKKRLSLQSGVLDQP
jgi:glycosyltransferase involved in cell wall biosynthesis